MRNKIMQYLLKLNGPQHHKGFLYAVEAIDLMIHDYCKPIGEIYYDIASKYKDNDHGVSRNIRTFLETTYEKGSQEELAKLHCSLNDRTNLPMNKEFLRAVTNQILIMENLEPQIA